MSRFYIVKLITPRDNSYEIPGALFHDNKFTSTCDWCGQPIDDYAFALERLKEELAPIGVVNTATGTLTFHEKEVLRERFAGKVKEALDSFMQKASQGCIPYHSLKSDLDAIFGIMTLFWDYDNCQSAEEVVTDYLNGDEDSHPRTVAFGEILQAHC